MNSEYTAFGNLYETDLKEYESRIQKIYHAYMYDICPFIILIESLDNEYPAEILNEIRAVVTHLARYYEFVGKDIEFLDRNIIDSVNAQIGMAERHIKRCKLDCYKYACLSYQDKINKVRNEYISVDLTNINRGEFIRSPDKTEKQAKKSFINAKKADTYQFSEVQNIDDSNIVIHEADYDRYIKYICDDDLYNMYENAYLLYAECNKLIDSNMEDLEYFKHKATNKDIATAISIFIGVIGIVLTILFGFGIIPTMNF